MNTPTKITFSRIIAIVIMIITLVVFYFIGVAKPDFVIPCIPGTNINWLYFGLFIFFVLASFTDFLDGYLARKNNQVTDLGKFLDPVADKLLVNSMVIFLIVPASYAPGQMSWSLWCAILLVARDIIVDALRFIAAQKGVVIAANIFGKAKTVLEMIAVSLVLLNSWPFSYFDSSWGRFSIANIFVYLCTIASVVSGVIYMVKYGHILVGKKDESGTSK
ncbi:MAG: CDP-diacylglycerol--glycerol-3-phosphate 3-phosphatidyltransferase [Bacilli bacterium]|nr:CDP-diacylglycerol--glycerol-3-phosphate 3-phosphatidyltransferase [Bacilli bacterium]